MKYLLDANTYINAKNLYYGMDICPAYWEWLDKQFSDGILASVDMIARELRAGNDDLAKWVKSRPEHFIANDDNATQQAFGEILNDVMTGDYNARDRDIFLSKGDPWIIAKSKVIDATVVTHEQPVSAASHKVKIPNICKKFEVPYINTFELLRNLKARFILG